MSQVARIATPLDAEQVSDALAEVLTGELARSDVLALLLALSDLETATWQRVSNYNLGNIIVPEPYQAEQAWYAGTDSGNTRRFRSYPSLHEGALGLVNQVTRDSRPEWRAGLATGNPEAFVRALSGANGGPAYFEANPGTYLTGFRARWKRYAPADPTGVTPPKQAPARLPGWALAVLWTAPVVIIAVIAAKRR